VRPRNPAGNAPAQTPRLSGAATSELKQDDLASINSRGRLVNPSVAALRSQTASSPIATVFISALSSAVRKRPSDKADRAYPVRPTWLERLAIGWKNWLFASTDEAGGSHAQLWTLIASAARHGPCL
jgi:hypothetical protein